MFGALILIAIIFVFFKYCDNNSKKASSKKTISNKNQTINIPDVSPININYLGSLNIISEKHNQLP